VTQYQAARELVILPRQSTQKNLKFEHSQFRIF
jgi:hypothetical protein